MKKTYSSPPGHWITPIKINHSHGIKAGNMIFVGGQVDFDDKGNLQHPGDIVTQTRAAMENMKRILEDLGATMDDVVQINTFYAGEATEEDWVRCAEIRFGYFKAPGPTATGIHVGKQLNLPGLMVEVNAIAVVD